MKGVLQLTKNCSVALFAVSVGFFITSCDGDEDAPKVMPEVTTAAISNITTTSATGGGNIVSDGNDQIIAMGLVYSTTTAPTTADSKTVLTSNAASFTSELTGLTSGTTYHVRAYATNSIGTAYGATIDFITGNIAPTVSDVTIEGDIEIDAVLTASYSYDDGENDPESGTTFKWYSSPEESGTGETPIDGATSATYIIKAADEFKYIRVGITPKASTGTTTGAETKSEFVGPVPEAPEIVTFNYNGQNVNYGVIVSSITGRKWLDRNLGASRVAISYQDYLAYGDLFQWGRLSDGHQVIEWTDEFTGNPKNETSPNLATDDVPSNATFISDGTNPDWRSPSNNNLWQAPQLKNDPCPNGWHIPTQEEWQAEISASSVNAENLKLTAAGFRRGGIVGATSGELQYIGRSGFYWSSTISITPGWARHFIFEVSSTGTITMDLTYYGTDFRGQGFNCRCIKDGTE